MFIAGDPVVEAHTSTRYRFMELITCIYEKDQTKVKLGKKVVGAIKHATDGWRYYPKGKKSLAGPPFDSFKKCLTSLLPDWHL